LKVIGLCGGSGSGKGTVAAMFSDHGIPCIDTDAVYHGLTSGKSECLDALTDEFGSEILNGDGYLNRKKLSDIVFYGSDSFSKRGALNRISHKFVLDEARRIILEYRKDGKEAVLVDAPLLFESGFDAECDVVICVIADKDVRISRIVARDGISVEEATKRIDSQLTDEYLIAHSDYTIFNSESLIKTRLSVNEIANKILCLDKGE